MRPTALQDSRGIWVKVCGITRPGDAVAAVEAGVSAVGLMFAESSRRLDLVQARLVRAAIPDTVLAIGVFDHTTDEDTLGHVVSFLKLGGVQLPAGMACTLPSWPLVLRTVRVRDASDLATPVDGVLHVDAYVEGKLGGTGILASWDAIEDARPEAGFVLSGGLRPDNVAEAVARLRPAGVDVSTGVESRPGIKAHDRMRAFVENARRASDA